MKVLDKLFSTTISKTYTLLNLKEVYNCITKKN